MHFVGSFICIFEFVFKSYYFITNFLVSLYTFVVILVFSVVNC